MSQLPSPSRRSTFDENSKNIGVLYTGYLEKKNPVSGVFKKRFVVLTHEALHWFVRTDGDDLFGEERGRIGLGAVISVRILEEDANSFQIETTDKTKRLFRSTSPGMCEEWVSAIKSTMKNLPEYTKLKKTLKQHAFRAHNEEEDSTPEVTVLLVSHLSDNEIILSRNPDWDRIIVIPNFKSSDKLLISLSNGGLVTLSSDILEMRSEGGVDFDVGVQNVTLASSLRLTVQKPTNSNNKQSNPYTTKSNSYMTYLISVFYVITNNRLQLIPFLLSIMVLLVGILTLPYFKQENALFSLFSFFNAIYIIYYLYNISQNYLYETRGEQFTLRIHAHSFTSPDDPINSPEDDIPQRFIDGCEGDMKEARRRWDITRHWRESEGLDKILTEPQPHFFTVKAMLPHYHYGTGKQGHIVYYERPGDIKANELIARGVDIDALYRHWLFVTEYQWGVLLKGDETAKTIAVLDIEKVNMSFFSGDPFIHLKRTVSASNQHYPERSFVIFVVNAPSIASMMWRFVSPMVHPNTQKKVRILTKKETLKGLQEHIDISQIPEYYGGNARCQPTDGTALSPEMAMDSCRFFGQETLDMNEYVRKINSGVPVSPTDGKTSSTNNTNNTTTNSGLHTSSSTSSLTPPGKQGSSMNLHGQGNIGGGGGGGESSPSPSIFSNNDNSPGGRPPVPPSTGVTRLLGNRKARGTVTGRPDMDSYSVCSDSMSTA